MARDLLIDIRAKDSASPVFTKLGQSAQQATDQIDRGAEEAARQLTELQSIAARMEAAFEKHARESGQAMQDLRSDVKSVADAVDRGAADMSRSFDSAMNRIEDSVDDASSSIKDAEKATVSYGRAADQMAKGLGLLGGAFTLYANQARDHERTIIAIERMYGEAAASYVSFADQIQNTSIFSNDEALEAARIMGTLRENYALTDQQIQQLIQTSADLASIHGYGLADAAQRVQSAIRGEAESAEMLGLTMNQAAIDTENLTLSMTNAEAAQFRFDAMMKQTASSVGAASQVAETTTGKVQQLANRTQDAALSFVGFTGPIGEAAAALGAFGIEGGLAATGLIQMGRGITSAAAAAGGLTALLGPAGLIVLGLGAAAIATKLFADSMRDDAAEAMKAARQEGEQLDATISAITANLSGAERSFASAILGSDDALDRMQEHLDYWQSLIDTWGSFPVDRLHLGEEALANLNEEERALLESQRLAVAYMQQYADEFGSVEAAADALAEAERDLSTILQHRGAGREQILTQLAELNEGYQNGTLTISEYIAALDELEKQRFKIDNDVILEQVEAEQAALIDLATEAEAAAQAWFDYEQAQNQAALASIESAQAIHLQRTALQELNGALQLTPGGQNFFPDDLAPHAMALRMATMRQFGEAHVEMARQLARSGADAGWSAKQFSELDRVIEQGGRTAEDAGYQFSQLTADIKSLDIARVTTDFETAMRAASGLTDTLYQLRASGGSASVDLAINTGGAEQALQSGYNAIVGGAQGMGQLADQTAEWAASLTEGNIGQSKLDDLLLKGAISGKTYRDALDANHRIQKANVSVQEDILRIQAKQLPVIAQLSEEHARYVDELADADVQTQTVALGFMDQTKAAQAMSLANLAATASLAGMSQVAGDMMIAMAETDPFLKAMLIDLGLLSEVDGELKFDFSDIGDADEAVTTLNGSIETLTRVIAKAFNIDINLDDGAAAVRLATIMDLLNQIDGKSVTAYVNTVGINSGALAGAGSASTGRTFTPRYVTGGTHGGSYAITGEDGPELLWLPYGSQVTNAPASREPIEQMKRDSEGDRGAIYNGPVFQSITYEESSFSRLSSRFSSGRR